MTIIEIDYNWGHIWEIIAGSQYIDKSEAFRKNYEFDRFLYKIYKIKL